MNIRSMSRSLSFRSVRRSVRGAPAALDSAARAVSAHRGVGAASSLGDGRRLLAGLAAGAALALAVTALPSGLHAQATAIVGGTVHPVDSPAIPNGVVVIEDGRISAVGPEGSVSVPDGARRIDARGRVVTPGFFDAATHVGLVEVGSVGGTRDYALDGDAVRAAFRVSDGLNPYSTVVRVTRAGGVTTVAVTPSGGAIAGQGAVLDLAGSTAPEMLVRDPSAVYAAINPGGAASAGGARGGLLLRLREVLDDARVYSERGDAYERGAIRSLSASRLDLRALQPVLERRLPLVVRASRAADIDAALRLADEYDLRLVIEGGEEAWLRADRLADAGVPVIVKPLSNLPTSFDRLGTRYDNAARLARAGVPVVISTLDTHNARNLRQEAGNAVRFGMEWDAALRAVTLAPAEAFGVADGRGSLEAGKAADIVVWSGDPFELSSSPVEVFIRGRRVDLDSRQKQLLERYRSLTDEERVSSTP